LQAVAHELFDPDRDPNQAADPEWRRQNIELVLDTLIDGRTMKARRASQPTTEIVSDEAALEAAADEWRALAVAQSNPFVTPDWFSCSLRHDDASKPFVPVVRRADGSLLGLMPLVLTTDHRYRTLRFAGADLGDRFEPVASEDGEETLALATARCLKERSGDWAILLADYADEGARWLQTLVREPGLVSMRYHPRASVYRSIALAGETWETYLPRISKKLRGHLRRTLRTLEQEHDVRFRRTLDPADLPADMERFFALHQQRWRSRGGTFLDDDRVRAFHVDFAAASLERGWLRLWSLDLDGEVIAVWYGWRMGEKYLHYQGGFDQAWSRHSPGLLLLSHTIRAAIEEGATEYDMLLGDEPYKSRFAATARMGRTIVVTRPLHPSRALVRLDVGLRRVIRALPPDVHAKIRRVARPVIERWPVKTAP
jgi:CelD/BcsL family acetyltransferase involved in cellulose biosynthesis